MGPDFFVSTFFGPFPVSQIAKSTHEQVSARRIARVGVATLTQHLNRFPLTSRRYARGRRSVQTVQIADNTARFNSSTVHGPMATRQSPSTLKESAVTNWKNRFVKTCLSCSRATGSKRLKARAAEPLDPSPSACRCFGFMLSSAPGHRDAAGRLA
jgi:hypothetical protein